MPACTRCRPASDHPLVEPHLVLATEPLDQRLSFAGMAQPVDAQMFHAGLGEGGLEACAASLVGLPGPTDQVVALEPLAPVFAIAVAAQTSALVSERQSERPMIRGMITARE